MDETYGNLKGGRFSRKSYWICLTATITALVALETFMPRFLNSSPVVVPVVLVLLARMRLHDAGKSGWWNLAWIIPQAVLCAAVFASGRPDDVFGAQGPDAPDAMRLRLAVNGSLLIIQIVFFTWIGLLKGDPGENRYGPPQLRKRAAA